MIGSDVIAIDQPTDAFKIQYTHTHAKKTRSMKGVHVGEVGQPIPVSMSSNLWCVWSVYRISGYSQLTP